MQVGGESVRLRVRHWDGRLERGPFTTDTTDSSVAGPAQRLVQTNATRERAMSSNQLHEGDARDEANDPRSHRGFDATHRERNGDGSREENDQSRPPDARGYMRGAVTHAGMLRGAGGVVVDDLAVWID